MSRTVGVVKWFDPKKGFGFIIGPEKQDVFVHFSVIESEGFRTLSDGEEVEYELVKGEKGYSSKAVRRLDDDADNIGNRK
jgi:cold shock protein